MAELRGSKRPSSICALLALICTNFCVFIFCGTKVSRFARSTFGLFRACAIISSHLITADLLGLLELRTRTCSELIALYAVTCISFVCMCAGFAWLRNIILACVPSRTNEPDIDAFR